MASHPQPLRAPRPKVAAWSALSGFGHDKPPIQPDQSYAGGAQDAPALWVKMIARWSRAKGCWQIESCAMFQGSTPPGSLTWVMVGAESAPVGMSVDDAVSPYLSLTFTCWVFCGPGLSPFVGYVDAAQLGNDPCLSEPPMLPPVTLAKLCTPPDDGGGDDGGGGDGDPPDSPTYDINGCGGRGCWNLYIEDPVDGTPIISDQECATENPWPEYPVGAWGIFEDDWGYVTSGTENHNSETDYCEDPELREPEDPWFNPCNCPGDAHGVPAPREA